MHCEPAPADDQGMALPSDTPDLGATTVLVVDDDPACLRLVARILRRSGYVVVEAPGPLEALEIAGDRRQPLDLLITDLEMPVMRGIQLAERVGQVRQDLPVLCLSGADNRPVLANAPSYGRSDFLLKPFAGSELISATAAMIGAAPESADAEEAQTPPAARRRVRWTGLPSGRTLPATEWQRRHRLLVWILWAHALLLSTLGVIVNGADAEAFAQAGVLGALALIAGWRRCGRRPREAAMTLGLLTSSAVIVHLSGGVTEAHFHYLIAIVLLSIYEEWLPFAIAIAYVLFQHGVIGGMHGSAIMDREGNPWFWSSIHALAVAFCAGATALTWRLNEDVRQTETAVRETLAHQARHDDLTGLPNRRQLVHELGRRSAHCTLGESGAAVLFVDVDHFKQINDSHGHSAGDRILVDIAGRLRASVRSNDIVFRTGSDEFVVLLNAIRSEDHAAVVADKILDALHAPFDVTGAARSVSVSIGVSCLRADDATVIDALSRADAAMYCAKADGRARVRVADAALLSDARRRTEIDTALNESSREQFMLHFQPIIDLSDGSIAAVEALLRWEHPTLGRVSPGEFIPIAESSGRILEIGRWILEMAAQQSVAWDDAHGRPVKVFVNVAGNELTHPSFARTVASAFAAAGATGRHIALELTETALARFTIPVETLDTLERAGVDLVLDDFGTGYSSLSYLSRFPIATIKLDRSFIASCSDDPASLVILDAVAQLARGLGIPALAEGIENVEQLNHVRQRGYALAQGYFFARPLCAPDVDALLSQRYPFAELLGRLRDDADELADQAGGR